jgi:hypothetical protein
MGSDAARHLNLGLVQSRPDNPVDPTGCRRLDPLVTAPDQQLLTDPVPLALILADLHRKPDRQLVGILGRALTESEMLTYLRLVVTSGPARQADASGGQNHG